MSFQWYRTLDQDGRRAFWTSFAGFGLDSMEIQLYGFVLPVLLALWGVSHTAAGALATVALVSSAAGGWLAGVLADRIGRVRMLQTTILWFAIATCLCGLARDFDQLLLARALQGLGFGGELAVGAVFVAEIARPQVRGRMVGMVQSGWAVGWGLAAISATVLLAVLPPDLGWRVTFLVGLVPALLVFAYRKRLRESPAFLSMSGRSSWRGIFSAAQRSTTMKGCLLATGMHGGYWAIATWWPTMLRAERGLSLMASSAYLGALIVGSFFGYVVGAWLGDRVGRRATLMGCATGGIVLALCCGQLPLADTMLILLSVPLGCFATGMYSVIGALLAEVYPTESRGSGLGFCYNFGRAAAGAAPLLVGGSVAAMGIGQALGLYVAGAYGVVLLAAVLLPETRGWSLKGLSDAS